MEDPFQPSSGVHDGKRGDLAFFQDAQGGGGQLGFPDGGGGASHELLAGQIERLFFALLQQAAEVSVRNDADQLIAGGDHCRHAEPFAAHFVDRFGRRSGRPDPGDRSAGSHQVLDAL